MNTGTKIRTALRVIVSVNTAIYAVTAAVNQLEFNILTTIWAILTIVSDFAVAFITTYYNNDYTETAAEFTHEMRLTKKPELDGYFDDEEVYDEDEDEDEDEDYDVEVEEDNE